MSLLEETQGYKPKDPDQKPFAKGDFVCNVEGMRVYEKDGVKKYYLDTSIINVVKAKPDNEAVMSDRITVGYKIQEEKGQKKFEDEMFVSGLDQFLKGANNAEVEAKFADVKNKLVYIRAYTFKADDGAEIQMAGLKSKNLITEENSQVTL